MVHHEHYTNNGKSRSLENMAAETDDKISYVKLLIDKGVIKETDGVPDEWFMRVKEIAEQSKVTNVETAQELAAIELLLQLDEEESFDQKIDEAKDLISEVIYQMAESEIPNINDDSVALIQQNAIKSARDGAPFFDAVVSAISTRRDMLKKNPGYKLKVDDSTLLVERSD